MDGTIIDSTDAIVKYWHKVGREINVDPGELRVERSIIQTLIVALQIQYSRLRTAEEALTS